MNVWILCNERAGRGLAAGEVREIVEAAGHDVLGVSKRYVERISTEAALDLVVAAGGDGTVAMAAEVAFSTQAALAILPLGTANNIARSLGLDGAPHELAAAWSTARRVPFDLARAQAASKQWLVVEGVGGGLVPAGIEKARADQKQQDERSASAEVAAAVRAFREALVGLEERSFTLAIDGTRIADEFLLVEILNIASVGPNLEFAPDASPSDGYLDVVMAHERHRDQLLAYLDHQAAGEAPRLSLPHCRAHTVIIETCRELHIDDEGVDTRDLEKISIEIIPQAITVLA